jgi:hypothetical protein
MTEPNDATLAKNPAYRPATEKALETGLFYGPDSPATRQARPAAGVTAVSVEPPGTVARRGPTGRPGYEPLRGGDATTVSFGVATPSRFGSLHHFAEFAAERQEKRRGAPCISDAPQRLRCQPTGWK